MDSLGTMATGGGASCGTEKAVLAIAVLGGLNQIPTASSTRYAPQPKQAAALQVVGPNAPPGTIMQRSEARSIRKIGLALVGALAVVGCEGLTTALIPPADEVQLGYELGDELRGELRFHPDPDVQLYLTTLGERILAEVPDMPSEYEFRFFVVDDDSVINAFAVPGGGVYMYTGLILSAQTEAEVAGVLGHEIAHVVERHGAKSLVTAYGVEEVLALLLGNNAPRLASMLSELAATGALLKYSRDNELESDREGVELVIDAGYSPEGLIRFFETLEQLSGSAPPQFLSTHPNPGNRVERLRDIIEGRTDLPTWEGDQAAFEAWQADIIGASPP
jgi:beta-barrel assembly-enhancing protease